MHACSGFSEERQSASIDDPIRIGRRLFDSGESDDRVHRSERHASDIVDQNPAVETSVTGHRVSNGKTRSMKYR